MENNTTNSTAQPQEKPYWKRVFTFDFWQEQNHWLVFLIILLLATLVLYLGIHSMEKYDEKKTTEYYDDPHEAEYKTMDEDDIQHITSLINEGSTFIDLSAADTTGNAVPNPKSVRFKNNPNNRVVKDFILQQLPYVYPEDTAKVFALLDQEPNSLAVTYIQKAKFKVKSYFWLAGPHTYLEIVFWTIFGVITSILFYIAMAISNGTGFKPSETPGHLAKIAYAPFISLIIIFSYNYISSPDSVVDVSASKGTLILSFLLGFYSSRAMKLLDKLKDVMLPYGDESKSVIAPTAKTDPEIVPPTNGSTVTVDVNLNDPQHPDAEELNGQIAQTVVTLTPQGGGEPITLTKTGEDELEGLFTAANIAAGNYTLAASLVTTDGANYNATQEIQVAAGENTYTLALTKTEISG